MGKNGFKVIIKQKKYPNVKNLNKIDFLLITFHTTMTFYDRSGQL